MKKVFRSFLAAAMIITMTMAASTTVFGAERDGVRVQFDGKTITFADADPQLANERTMVSARAILEAIGADVAYDAETKTITAKKGNKEISFTANGSDLTIIDNGVRSIKKMDTAAYTDSNTGRVFVPVRYIAESMGYGIGWDPIENTAVIIDPSTIFANADQDFSIISKLAKPGIDLEKTYESTGQFNLAVEMPAEGSLFSGMSFSAAGKLNGIQQKSNMDMAMSLAFDFSKMLSTMTTEEKESMKPILDMYSNLDMKIKMNGETGDTYISSDTLNAFTGAIGKDTWYKMNSYDSYADRGIDMKSIMNQYYADSSITQMMEASVISSDISDVSAYQDMKTMYELCKNLFGDKAFTTDTSGLTKTYTLNIDQEAVLAALAKTALTEGIANDDPDFAGISDALKDSSFRADIVIRDYNDSQISYSIKGTFVTEEINGSVDISGTPKTVSEKIVLDQKDAMKISMDLNSNMTETSKTLDLLPPAGADIVDFQTPGM